jgi:hypothetical protein
LEWAITLLTDSPDRALDQLLNSVLGREDGELEDDLAVILVGVGRGA